MKAIFFVFFSVVFFFGMPLCRSQVVIIEEDVKEQRRIPDRGVNRKHFRHPFLGYHFFGVEQPGAELLFLRSGRFETGQRYKRKLSETFSFGYDWSVKRDAFFLKQEEGKLVPGPEMHDKEKLVFSSLGAGLYQRINVGKRGNHMGSFMDIGVYGDWHFFVRHVTHDRQGSQLTKIKRSGLSFHEPFAYGALARFGHGRVVLKLSYRLSDTFKASAQLPELPRLSAGIEFGMHP